ncbi:cytochrome P450 [Triangularia setosa]|uniref:Cytochrome P450 n=1 Tax=Triangularia setosa TaxID=2587417 RepID=A0AAN6W4S2_9PEZI|nr:cytochrome P450 [Podospora setosa]
MALFLELLENAPAGSGRAIVVFITIVFILNILFLSTKYRTVSGSPVAGQKWWFEPLVITRYRFLLNGWAVTRAGWDQYGDRIFTIARPDSTITVVPPQYLDELQNLPDTKLNGIQALAEDMGDQYSGISILKGTHLTFNVVRNKLTPRMGAIIPPLMEELEHAMKAELPASKEWVAVDLGMIFTRIISRLTTRVWVGKELSRNNTWHTDNIWTTENIFITALLLRFVPPVLHPVLGACLPTRRRIREGIRKVQSYLVPLIEERRRRQAQHGAALEPEEDVLQWLMDGASEEESPAENLAERYVYSVIGSLYTVSGALTDCLFDLAEHPEYVEPLRQELRQTLAESRGQWERGTASKLLKMDSFMKESLRTNAPSPFSQKRIVKEELTLSDGAKLPSGAYICMIDQSAIGRGPDKFDGFRYAGLRQDPGFMTKYQYTSTDRDHLTFGHGRLACPGRFVASLEMKMVLAAMLERYEISFHVSGQGGVRPKKIQVLELAFHNPATRVYLRQK